MFCEPGGCAFALVALDLKHSVLETSASAQSLLELGPQCHLFSQLQLFQPIDQRHGLSAFPFALNIKRKPWTSWFSRLVGSD